MKKTTTQLLIAATALAVALALVAYAAPSFAEATCPPDAVSCTPAVKPWHKLIEDNDGAEFVAAWNAADGECKGDTQCIERKLHEQGWQWQAGN